MKNTRKYACGGSSFAHAMFNQHATNKEYMNHEVEQLKEIFQKNGMVLQVTNRFGKYRVNVNGLNCINYNLQFVEECRKANPYLFRNIILDHLWKIGGNTIKDEEKYFWRKEYLAKVN